MHPAYEMIRFRMSETMNDHPSYAELGALVRGLLSPEKVDPVVRHLLLGPCRACFTAVPELRTLFGIAPLNSEPSLEEGDAYADVIQAAFQEALRHERRLQKEKQLKEKILVLLEKDGLKAIEKLPRKWVGLALLDALIERSWALRRDDPSLMIQLSLLATRVAQGLDAVWYGTKRIADFQCRAWIELANAYRVADQLDAAWSAMGLADKLYEQGTEDKVLGIRLLDVQASLAADCRQFGRACQALSLIYKYHIRDKNQHLAGRALISNGLYIGYAGQPEKAIQLIREGLSLIDKDLDPDLAFAAVHNELWFLVECGRFEEARKSLFAKRKYCNADVGRVSQLKIAWLEGRIDVGYLKHDRAEGTFRMVKEGLSAAGLPFQASLAALDLAAVLMIQKRPKEAEELVVEAARVFTGLRIEREALGAVLMLKKSFEMRQASAEMVEEVAAFVRRTENDPNARFDPRPR